MSALRLCKFSTWLGLVLAVSGCSEGDSEPSGVVGRATPQAGSSGAGGGAGAPSVESSGGAAGAPGASSAGSAGSGSAEPPEVASFDADLDGFRINYYCAGSPPACVAVMDAPAEGEADAGGADAGDAPPAPANDFVAAVFDATVGEPEPGSARITLQFSADGQLAEFARNFGDGMTPGLNLSGKVLSARARVEAGGAPTVAAKFYIKTGMAYSYADSGEVTLVPDTWMTLRYQTPSYVNDAALYDISDVREIGIEILGRGATAEATTIVHIDTIEY